MAIGNGFVAMGVTRVAPPGPGAGERGATGVGAGDPGANGVTGVAAGGPGGIGLTGVGAGGPGALRKPKTDKVSAAEGAAGAGGGKEGDGIEWEDEQGQRCSAASSVQGEVVYVATGKTSRPSGR